MALLLLPLPGLPAAVSLRCTLAPHLPYRDYLRLIEDLLFHADLIVLLGFVKYDTHTSFWHELAQVQADLLSLPF